MSFVTKCSTPRPSGYSVYAALLAIAVILSLGLSGCGGGGDSNGGGGPETGGGSPPPSDGGGGGGSPPPSTDDHSDYPGSATRISPGSSRSGELRANDRDYFEVTLDRDGRLEVYTTGGTDTVGILRNAHQTEVASDDDGGDGRNFRFVLNAAAGTYHIRVTGYDGSATGRYTLHVRFTPSGGGETPPGDDDSEMPPGAHGDVRVNLTWYGDVDLDLYVTNPCGQVLGYQEDRSNTCNGFVGRWDLDDTGDDSQHDNPNAENIVWTDGAPPGRYSIHVRYFYGSDSVDYTVRVFSGSQQRTYTGRLERTHDYRTRRHVVDIQFGGNSSSQGAEESRFEAGSQALSQAARSLGMSAIEAMRSRGQTPGGSSLTLAGHRVSLGNGTDSSEPSPDGLLFTGGDADLTEFERPERAGSWREFLHGSRFDVAVGEETRVWGEAHGIEGGNETRFLGFERGFGQGLAAGMAFSDTANEGNFGLAESESLQASLASAYQYLHFSPGASTELWSLVGTGQGELSLTDDIGTVATDLSMQMLAFGSSQGLGPLVAGFAPTVSADGFLVRLESERRAGLRPLAGEASRLRTGVLFERPAEGDGWTPKIGFGVRHEDDERGVATRTEVMAGFGYALDRLRIEGMTYLWPTGSGEVEAVGAGAPRQAAGARMTARYRTAPNGRGLTVSVDALSGLVSDAPVWKTDDVAGRSTSVHLQAGYGFASGLGRWMPYGEIQLDGDEQRLREGVRQNIGALSLDLYGEHQLGEMPEHGIHVGVTARY